MDNLISQTNPPVLQKQFLTAFIKNPWFRAVRYLFRRALAIALTIVFGIFVTMVIANRGGMVDKVARDRVDAEVFYMSLDQNFQGDLSAVRQALEAKEGLTLSFWPKHLFYTYKALTLDWGNVWDHRKFGMYVKTSSGVIATDDSRTIIFSQLPNTLLLSGTAYLLLAILGIPLALFLSQREGHWLDRLIGILTPLSSVPSWVFGVLLVVVFAVEFKWFPVGKMIGALPPQTLWETVKVVSYHLVLPVLAIVLSLIFQLVSNWRTFLLIYSEEDYVTLARSKGLRRHTVEIQYILRPVLPYMLTSFALMLVGFWQTITALEFFFQWPGIGKLFVDALPNFHGESMYRGEMTIVIGIVVLFAYLLGVTVFLLDIFYVLVDPRIRVEQKEQISVQSLRQAGRTWIENIKGLFRRRSREYWQNMSMQTKRKGKIHPFKQIRTWIYKMGSGTKQAWKEIRREPAAILGFLMVLGLIASAIAVTKYIPYDPIGREWTESYMTGHPTSAKLALPKWINFFRKDDLPSTIVLSSQDGTAVKQLDRSNSELPTVQIDFTFDYSYQDFPSDLVLYINGKYVEKTPFISLTWITPDGREISLKNTAVTGDMTYPFSENVPFRRLVMTNEHWKKWVVTTGDYQTPGFYLLFADPIEEEPVIVPGTYTLRLNGILFEQDSDLDAQLVVFGQVEGWAGTDHLRRDLIVPLLWGLPFALVIGVLGSLATALASLIIGAVSAWFGGWVDGLIQRAIEANLILPVMAVGVLLYAYYGFNLWLVLGLIVLLNVLGSPTKAFRAAFLQIKESGYIEAAQVYGASNWRIITQYLIPRILPVIVPQIVILIPNFFFLEATLAIFNISDPRYPTWGRVVYSALRYGAAYGSRYWVLEPISLMLLTGLAFALLGFALNRILNPRLKDV